ncbi:uncharacterized protein CPUR_08756, partial [Claviceps purpurea 20.1]
MYLCTYF